jgi:hypothetical protein
MAWNNDKYTFKLLHVPPDSLPRTGSEFPRVQIAESILSGFFSEGTVMQTLDGSGTWMLVDGMLKPAELTADGWWITVPGTAYCVKQVGRNKGLHTLAPVSM